MLLQASEGRAAAAGGGKRLLKGGKRGQGQKGRVFDVEARTANGSRTALQVGSFVWFWGGDRG